VLAQLASIPTSSSNATHLVVRIVLLHRLPRAAIGHRIAAKVRMVPPGLAATAQAIYGTVAIGAMTSLLTLASGTLYGHFGASGFWAMAGLCLIALPFIAKLAKADPGNSAPL
jgi:hypothetical protein